ncbi:MAG: CHASE2 domain-containing protein [Alkalispirochaeta sp.]
MDIKRFVTWILPGILLVVFATLELLGVFAQAEHSVYDAWLHLKPSVPEREEILYLDIDDLAIAQVGVWPWSRDIMARGLTTLREFESGPAVLDIEYVDSSPLAVDGQFLRNRIPDAFDREFTDISGSVESLIGAIAAGQIPPEEAGDFLGDLRDMTESAEDRLLTRVQEIVRDNDLVLGAGAKAHGDVWFTVNLIPDAPDPVPRERIDFAIQETALTIVEGENDTVLNAEGLRPAIEPVIDGAAGAGFPNVIIDQDGTRRRIELLRRFEGHWFGQLVFPPLIDWLGVTGIEVSGTRIVLEDALVPGAEERRDIRIPLAEDGTMLINWSKGGYLEGFRHISFYEVVYYQQLLEDLAYNLEVMEESGYLQYHDGDRNLLDAYRYAEGLVNDALETGDQASLDELAAVREFFITEAGAFLEGDAEELILADIDDALEDPNLSPDMESLFTDLQTEIPSVFESTRTVHADLVQTREVLSTNVPGSFVIIGYTGTGTTDIGVNPFENEYANTGTHGAIVNTILTGRFLDDLPAWISIIIAVIFTVIFVVLSRNRNANTTLILGFAGAAMVTAGSETALVTLRTFLPIMTPVLTLFLAAVGQSAYKFVEVAREKNHIRHAFNHYLSTDVINEILDDPSRLRLGGEKRELTAMFTDVKGFSTISESLDPEELVKLLNRYLSEMSDIVLQLRGTIDKYEGDAIISFFGAPIPYQDHASRACAAAVRMKKIENYLNDHFLEENLSPSPLMTRIGINTGEMVVGNMGTANRMDYTIMGHAVNLAARLEGVNKQYGTWILTSELTYDATGTAFAARKLDRVRVVGVSEPVRLYEIMDEAELVPKDIAQLIDEFHNGIELFEHREWGEASSVFSRLNREFPDDGPSKTYFDRTKKFQKEAPPADWDGVFNLTRK